MMIFYFLTYLPTDIIIQLFRLLYTFWDEIIRYQQEFCVLIVNLE